MTTYKDWLIFLIGANFIFSNSAFPFSFSLDKQTIQVGETVSFRIQLPISKRSERPLVFDELLSQHKKLKLLEQQAQRIENTYHLTFEITAYEPNEYFIPPIQIKLGPDSLSTEAVPLKVVTTRQKDDVEIRPDFEPLRKPFPWRRVYAALMWVLACLVLLWWVRWAFQRFPWRKTVLLIKSFSFPKWESRRTWLRHELKRIRLRLETEPQANDILDDAFFTLKKYFEKTVHRPVPTWTQRELQNRLQGLLIKRKLKLICNEVESLQYHSRDKSALKEKTSELLATMERELL